jgi:hypothetical protein
MAAGLGFKTFTTGEVLTADNVNGYLMQGVLVFASAAARDAAITSPQEGQCCYLKDTDAVQTYSGSAWVGFDDSNAIQNSIVDAKGDIVAASGNDTPARLAVGNNGDTLVADSAATTGLRYQASRSAGKNAVINGGIDIWQRGTSLAISNGVTTYLADRWAAYRGATGATVSRQTTSDTTNLPTIQYCARVQRDNANASTSGISYFNIFESVNSIPYAGQTVTFSFYARAGANYSQTSSGLTVVLKTGTGTDQNIYSGFTGAVNAVLQTATLTTTWQRFTYTATLASSITQIAVGFEFAPVGTAGAADYFEVTGAQLELGSVATTFSRAQGTIQGELAACQRYYYRQPAGAINQYFSTGGLIETSTSGWASISATVTMRTAPTSIDYSGLAMQDSAGSSFTPSAVTLFANGTGTNTFRVTTTVSGATGGRWAFLRAGSVNDYIGFSAEL